MQRILAVALACLFAAPLVAAEFGEETPEGYPIGIDGPITPFVYQHWIDRNPEVERIVRDYLESQAVPGLDVDAALADPTTTLGAFAQENGDPVNKVMDMTLYPYYPILVAELFRLAEEYPDLVRLHSAGQSRLGMDLWYLEIADFGNPDRVPIPDREVVYLDGGTHSNEYSGVYFVTEWAQFLLDEFATNETARWIVENRYTIILPMVNPDGSNAFGRINALTVNVNRNFPSTWGAVNELPGVNWPGPYPASEPETQAVIETMLRYDPDYVNSIHCCGNLWLHPFGAEHLGKPVDSQMFDRTCDEVFYDVRPTCGQIWSTIYPASGTTADEGYGLLGASSWTYEMSGRGAFMPWGQPIITGDPRVQETEAWRGIMHAFLYTEKYGAHPVVTAVEGSGDRLDVTVHNAGYGNLTQGALTVAGQSVSFGTLLADETRTYTFRGTFGEGDIPLELEWKKRHHPEAKWGRSLVDVTLEADGRSLTGILPVAVAKPSMADLMPPLELDDGDELGTDSSDGTDASEKSTPNPAFFLVAFVVLVAARALRRRD